MAHGGKRKGAGRKAGSTTPEVKAAREAIADFVENNSGKLQDWLDKIAKDDPKGAFDRFMAVTEYHIPKLSRVEQQALDKDGEPADQSITIKVVRPDARNND